MEWLRRTGTLPLDWLTRRPRFRADLPILAGWVLFFVGLELSRRWGWSRSEFHDAVGVALLIVALLWTLRRHGERPLEFLTSLGRLGRATLRRVFGPWRVSFGLDLRAAPPVPHHFPRPLAAGLLLVTCIGVALAVWHGSFPGVLRTQVGAVSHALYTLLLAVLWTLALVGGAFCYCVPLFYLQAALSASGRWRRRVPELESVAGLVYVAVLVAAAVALPAWFPLMAVAAALGVLALLALVRRPPRLITLWRFRTGGPLWSTGWARLIVLVHVLAGLSFAAFAMLLNGQGLTGRGSALPITSFLGGLFAWTFTGAFLAECYQMGSILLMGRRLDPRRSCTAPVVVRGVPDSSRGALRAALGEHGLRLVQEGIRGARAAPVLIWKPDPSGNDGSAAGWPRPLSPADLSDPGFVQGLLRRSEIQARRRLLHGLRRIFKQAARRRWTRGSGYWVAPHLWFVTHLGRDVDEPGGHEIHPSYQSALPVESRRHLRRVLDSLEVDLIFLEDGISFRRFKRVLSLLFEYYDIFGERPVDTVHFSGLPGLRVMLDEFDMATSPGLAQYPEPDYEGLGRARILFVFHDRGDPEENPVVPDGWDYLPEPESPLVVGPSAWGTW